MDQQGRRNRPENNRGGIELLSIADPKRGELGVHCGEGPVRRNLICRKTGKKLGRSFPAHYCSLWMRDTYADAKSVAASLFGAKAQRCRAERVGLVEQLA